VANWYLPTLSQIIALSEPQQDSRMGSPAVLRLRAERQWSGAIAALNLLLQQVVEHTHDAVDMSQSYSSHGLILSGPSPILAAPDLMAHFGLCTLSTPQPEDFRQVMQMLPAAGTSPQPVTAPAVNVALTADDPLAMEQFCLVLTAEFSLVMALAEDADHQPAFLFSFTPEIVWQGWRSLRSRLTQLAPHLLRRLDRLVAQFAPVTPDYRTVTQFSRLLLAQMPEPIAAESAREITPFAGTVASQGVFNVAAQMMSADLANSLPTGQSAQGDGSIRQRNTDQTHPDRATPLTMPGVDVELLRAIAHEVRTPLSTIRTLTRLLLKRKSLSPDIVKRLEAIDRECTEQIDRFNLIFRAVELETETGRSLAVAAGPISLHQVLEDNIPRWQTQVSQHNLTLNVNLPPHLPMVMADATMLDQMLTGIIDRITHSLVAGGHIDLQVKTAGHQLKIQFQSYPSTSQNTASAEEVLAMPTAPRAIGDVLIVQPETGNLSLNLSVTKNLFQALGGKLIVRQRPQQGEELTIFLPMETRVGNA
jgi:hypothetical protein